MVYVEPELTTKPLAGEQDTTAWMEGLRRRFGPDDMALIEQAITIASRAHDRQTRASGEPYLIHAIAVADIIAGLRMDAETLAAAILHDVVEDSEVTLPDIEACCGAGVARMVDGVTKMDVIRDYHGGGSEGAGGGEKGRREQARAQGRAESMRKMLLAMAEDVRVVLIKLADRLHNMRTLVHLPVEKQRRIAQETLDIYAPLANRLGISQIKWELEDLSFRYLDPAGYKEIARFLDERRVDRTRYIEAVTDTLERELGKAGIKARISGRPKHIYSIWKKMQRKGLGFHQLYDVRAVRILVDNVADCYHALGVVHTLWRHIPKEFDDYIATPKENLYQSIHTAVVGPQGKTLEVQIRTYDMDRHAELGVAAHWQYKEGGKRDRDFEQKVAWLRQLLQWKEEESNAGDFIDRFKSEVFQDRVYILTPRGEVMDLPQGATPLDFAYHVHTEVGNRCRGAKVNGRIVPLTYELKSGEQVEVLTTRHGGPSRDWLNPHLGYLKTSRALSKVRHWFKQQDQQHHLTDGRAVVERELHRLGGDNVGLEALATELGFAQVEEMLIAVGRTDVTTTQIAGAVHRLIAPPEPTPEEAMPLHRRPPGKGTGGDIHIRGVGNLITSIARCCKPAPGDPIIGFITRGHGVTIHRADCRNILKLPPEKRARLIEVEWSGREQPRTYSVDVEVIAIDRPGLIRDISGVLANEKVNVSAFNTQTDRQYHSARMLITLDVVNTDQLSRVLNRISQLANVQETRRRG